MEVVNMNYLIILNSSHQHHFEEVHKLICDYDASIRVNPSTWLIHTHYDATIIRQHLTSIISIHDSLLVFKIDQEHSFTNDLDLNDWLEDIHNESAISL
jgi:hypothetical protein